MVTYAINTLLSFFFFFACQCLTDGATIFRVCGWLTSDCKTKSLYFSFDSFILLEFKLLCGQNICLNIHLRDILADSLNKYNV